MLELLIVVVLALHLLCVNVASAGPLVCIWLDWRGRRGDALAARVGRFLCWKSLSLLLVGGGLGLILGGLHWDDAYREVLRRFPSKIFFGVLELIFSFVLIFVTGVLWRVAPYAKSARWGRAVLLVLAGTNLLYHFPFLFAIISRVDRGATSPDGIVDASLFRSLMMEDSVLPQAVHFGFASFAVVGITLLGYALWIDRHASDFEAASPELQRDDAAEHGRDEQGDERFDAEADGADGAADSHGGPSSGDRGGETDADWQRIATWGARLALGATLCQLPVGLWLVVKLSPDIQQRVLGADPIAGVLLGVSIVLTLGLLHHLSSLALNTPQKKNMVVAIAMMAVLVTLMTGVLQRM